MMSEDREAHAFRRVADLEEQAARATGLLYAAEARIAVLDGFVGRLARAEVRAEDAEEDAAGLRANLGRLTADGRQTFY